jgi:hypothetical protein
MTGTSTADPQVEVEAPEEGAPHHGVAEPRGQEAVPRSPLFEGRFGRLFRRLPAPLHDREALIGQFVDHDITFDPISSSAG